MPKVAQKIQKICLGCGRRFYVLPSRSNKKYCSKSCYLKHRPVWNKGLTKETDPRVRKISEKLKRLFQDPKYKKKWYDKQIKIRQTKEYRQKISEKTKQQWKDPIKRARLLAGIRSEETRKKISEASKKQWSNPEYRNRVIKKIRETRKRRVHEAYIQKFIEEYEKQGFKCIPISYGMGVPIPDFIAIKDGKVYAVEVMYKKRPNYSKYQNCKYYDDIQKEHLFCHGPYLGIGKHNHQFAHCFFLQYNGLLHQPACILLVIIAICFFHMADLFIALIKYGYLNHTAIIENGLCIGLDEVDIIMPQGLF